MGTTYYKVSYPKDISLPGSIIKVEIAPQRFTDYTPELETWTLDGESFVAYFETNRDALKAAAAIINFALKLSKK